MRALTVGLAPNERVRPLLHGITGPGTLELRIITAPAPEILRRMSNGAEFDVGEYSLSDHLRAFAAGTADYVALPVFPHRAFRHSMLWVRTASDLTDPADLRGKRVGVDSYATTALVFLRGMLQDEHGVGPSDITWIRTVPERIPIDIPVVRIEDRAADLGALLESGEVDAIAPFQPPAAASAQPPRARHLISDVRAVEAEYYKRTGIFPIMHVLVLRRPIHESDPTVAPRLVTAFEEAKRVASAGAPASENAFRYGVEPNRPTLEAAFRYARTQLGIALPDDVAELFPASTRT